MVVNDNERIPGKGWVYRSTSISHLEKRKKQARAKGHRVSEIKEGLNIAYGPYFYFYDYGK